MDREIAGEGQAPEGGRGSGAPVHLQAEPITSPVAQALITALNQELTDITPEGACFFRLDEEEVDPRRGAFLVAYRDDQPVGCGAVRRLDGERAELKRMYVIPAARGGGVAKALIAGLEREARRLGVKRVLLETGRDMAGALALYRGAGYVDVPRFGPYVNSDNSACLAKEVE